jgi:hypothetical protein
VRVNTLDIIVHDKDGKDITGAEIEIVPWMPAMRDGVFEKPVVNEGEDGIYRVENVILIMEGRWELRLKIKKNNTEDSITFDFSDVRR